MARRRSNGEGSIYEQKKHGRWCAQITVSLDPATGKPKRRAVYGKTQAEVRAKLDQLKKLRDENALNTPSRMTIAEWSVEWLKHAEQHVRPRTHEGYERWVNTYIIPKLGRVRLEKLTGRDIQRTLDELAATHRPRVPQLTRTILGIMFNYAVLLGVIPRNPVQSTRAPKLEREEMKFWEPHEAAKFIQQIQGHRLEAAFYLAIVTGMRKGEILGLTWADVEPDRLHVRRSVAIVRGVLAASAPKTRGSRRMILITPDISAKLAVRRAAWAEEKARAGTDWQAGDYVFTTGNGRPLTPHNLDTAWKKLRKESGLPTIRFHDLRHTYSSLALAQGADIPALSDRLGHANPYITMTVYSHVLADRKTRLNLSAADLLGDALNKAVGNETG